MWVIPQPAQAKPKAETKQVIEQSENEQSHKTLSVSPTSKRENKPPKRGVVRLAKPQQGVRANSGRYTGRVYSKEEVENLIRKYSDLYGISSDTPRCIAFHESGYNQTSANKRSSAKGVFQYLDKTWKATDEGKAGLSVFDADANVKAAVKYMAIHKSTKPWTTRTSCPPLKFIH